MKESKFIREMQPRLTAVSDGLNSWLDLTAIAVIRENNTVTNDFTDEQYKQVRCLSIVILLPDDL